jgi:hypothetical protein
VIKLLAAGTVIGAADNAGGVDDAGTGVETCGESTAHMYTNAMSSLPFDFRSQTTV